MVLGFTTLSFTTWFSHFSALPVAPFSVSWEMPLRLQSRLVDFGALKHLRGFSVALKSDQDNSWVTSFNPHISVVFHPLSFGIQSCRKDRSQDDFVSFFGGGNLFSLSAFVLA